MNEFERSVIERAIEFARTKMKNVHSCHGWDHVHRVVKSAERIAATEPDADLFIVTVAAILHDIARGEEDASNGAHCHSEIGSGMAKRFLTDCGLDERRASLIARCVLTHRYRNSVVPSTIEEKILYDADKLDSIGAVGIGRAFLFSGEIGARLHNDGSEILGTDAYSDEDTAYREYMVKLRLIKDTMRTAEGRRIASGRHDFMERFFLRLKDETGGLS